MMTTQPQVLVVTRSASLVIGLTFAAHDWEISSQSPAEQVPDDVDVVVLDLPDPEQALDRAARLTCPGVLVLSADPGAMELPEGVVALLRPFTAEELVQRIASALGVDDRPPDRETGGDPASTDADVPAPAGVPGSDAPPASLTDRLFGRFSRATSQQTTDEDVDLQVIIDVREEPSEPPASRPHAATVDLDDGAQPLPHDSGQQPDGSGPSPHPSTVQLTAPQVTGELGTGAPVEGRRTVALTTVGHGVIAPQIEPTRPATRWRARRRAAGSDAEQALRARLGRVLAATSELEALLDELPLLADRTAFARGVILDTLQLFQADSVALWRRGERGWIPIVHHGFTRHEATWIVPFDQPLFAELDATGGAMLIDPVEQVQAAVAGIAGAHTESLMAAAVAIGPGRYGVLVVGRDQPLEVADLDLLAELAMEAAPGLAVAEQVQRLGALAAVAGSHNVPG